MLLHRGQSDVSFLWNSCCPLFLPLEHPLLLGGDYNCVAEGLDVVGGDATSVAGRQVGYWGGLQACGGPHAPGRCLPGAAPGQQEITHVVRNSAARLDRWLITLNLLPRVWAADIGVGEDQLPGDHRAVSLNLHAGRQGPAVGRGPGDWMSLCLKSQAFLAELRAAIHAFDASQVAIALTPWAFAGTG